MAPKKRLTGFQRMIKVRAIGSGACLTSRSNATFSALER
jgi:hypothetical protein